MSPPDTTRVGYLLHVLGSVLERREFVAPIQNGGPLSRSGQANRKSQIVNRKSKMSHASDPAHILVVGGTGSGKTTWTILHALNVRGVACQFFFDWNERIVPRLPWPACYTEADCERALQSRKVVFNPKRLFPGAAYDRKQGLAALKWFAGYVRRKSKSGRGRKLFHCAELWNFCTEDSIPSELALLAQDGRQDEVSFVLDTQRPEKLNPSIIGATTELVCFRLDEKRALRAVEEMGMDSARVQALPLGSFIALNRLAPPEDPERVLAGKVF